MTCDIQAGAISTQDYAMLSQLAYRDLVQGQKFSGIAGDYIVFATINSATSSYSATLFYNLETATL